MNKISILIDIALIAIVISSCTRDKNHIQNGLKTTDININKINNKNHISFDAITSKLAFVRLESKKNCYIATINKVIQTGKYYLILDKTQSRLFVFDTLGTFQHTIGHRGIGPESFRDITSIAFINNKQHIIIHSNRDMALFIYL